VDAVLFNGGSLHAAVLRQRVLDQIAAWQDGARPIELENAEPDLAVARGAARFGKLLHGHAGRIAAGAARALFLPVQVAPAATNQADPPALICVLPLNAAAEQVFEINLPGLELRTKPVGELSSLFLDPSWPLPAGRRSAVGRGRLRRRNMSHFDDPCRRSLSESGRERLRVLLSSGQKVSAAQL
jgi:hypothetical protein